MAHNESRIIATINWESERLHQRYARTGQWANTRVGLGSYWTGPQKSSHGLPLTRGMVFATSKAQGHSYHQNSTCCFDNLREPQGLSMRSAAPAIFHPEGEKKLLTKPGFLSELPTAMHTSFPFTQVRPLLPSWDY